MIYIDHMYVLRIQNTSESDPRNYEAIQVVANKAQKKASTGFEPMISAISLRCSTN